MDSAIAENVRNCAQNDNNCCQGATGLTSTIVDTERNLSTTVDITPLPSRSATLGPLTGRLIARIILLNFPNWGGVTPTPPGLAFGAFRPLNRIGCPTHLIGVKKLKLTFDYLTGRPENTP